MHIGLDMLLARWTQTGMHTYLRNLSRELHRIVEPHRLTPFLYGHPDAGEPDHIRNLAPATLSRFRYVWDCTSMPLLSDCVRRPQKIVRRIDHKLLIPGWRAWASRRKRRKIPPLAGDVPDLFHHVAFRVYPLQRVNVYTLPDLGTLGEPESHPQIVTDLIDEGLPLASCADLVLTYSEHTRKDAANRLGLSPERILVTPLAAHEQFQPIGDPEVLLALKRKYRIDDRPYFLAIGRLEARKNLVRLLEAYALLKRSEPIFPHRLVLAGEKSWGVEAIFAAIERLGLNDDVMHLDFVPFEDLPALIGAAECLVHPSIYEGFGLPPLEAMACGTPVVAADATSLPEVVGDAGLLFDPLSPDSIAAALRRVVADADLRAKLRMRGLAQSRKFTWERTARLTLSAYEEADRLSREEPIARPPLPLYADRARGIWRLMVIDGLLNHTWDRLKMR